jgi:hypothetical protein
MRYPRQVAMHTLRSFKRDRHELSNVGHSFADAVAITGPRSVGADAQCDARVVAHADDDLVPRSPIVGEPYSRGPFCNRDMRNTFARRFTPHLEDSYRPSLRSLHDLLVTAISESIAERGIL